MIDERGTMSIEDARKIIAAYLSGYDPNGYRFVSDDELQQALENIKLDEDYYQYLMKELGMGIDWRNECEVFLSHLAEFSEMLGGERKHKMPDLLAHAEICRSCRDAYWYMKPIWETRVIEELKKLCKRLSEPISLAVGEAGKLFNRGLNPLDKDEELVVAIAMGEKVVSSILGYENGDTEPKLRKEWKFEDEETNCIIHLVVSGRPAGEVEIEFWLECGISAGLQPEDLSIQLYKYENGSSIDRDFSSEFDSPFFDDSLSALPKRLILNKGSWLIRVQARNNTWELPLNIEVEGRERNQ